RDPDLDAEQEQDVVAALRHRQAQQMQERAGDVPIDQSGHSQYYPHHRDQHLDLPLPTLLGFLRLNLHHAQGGASPFQHVPTLRHQQLQVHNPCLQVTAVELDNTVGVDLSSIRV